MYPEHGIKKHADTATVVKNSDTYYALSIR
jgi:hypothetical protein